MGWSPLGDRWPVKVQCHRRLQASSTPRINRGAAKEGESMIARERAVGEVPEILLEVNLEGIRIYDFEGGRGGVVGVT